MCVGGCGVRELVAVKDVGALGGAGTSVLPGNLDPVGPETERLLRSHSSGPLGAEDVGCCGILRV